MDYYYLFDEAGRCPSIATVDKQLREVHNNFLSMANF